MSLKDQVHITRRFQRSIRIDTDLHNPAALEGFISSQTFDDVLTDMARHFKEAGQGAFTWTGSYGGGKSSLAVALSAILSGNNDLQKQAKKIFDSKVLKSVSEALPPNSRGWRILPVVGRRDDPAKVIGEALLDSQLIETKLGGKWSEKRVLDEVSKIAASNPRSHGGLVIFIDEMGKFFEGAAQEGLDLYIFQQLAELASRSNGRLLVIGILHQAFEEYAHRLSREMRVEWGKVQGRFIDLSLNTSGDEQIALISRAIETKKKSRTAGKIAKKVASVARDTSEQFSDDFAILLENCWPLHPAVACLLGPISRRRFGQNQRSIFGFLNSAERHGLQDFLTYADENDLYTPDKLWDYLRVNFEASILASPDGHRWAVATNMLARCESQGGDHIDIALLKTIAVVDLFKDHSGLAPSIDLLQSCFPKKSKVELEKVLTRLKNNSLITFKKFLKSYALYAGSDFDIETAMQNTLGEIEQIDFLKLKEIADLHPILAKRHYHDTGAMRWFDVTIASLGDIEQVIAEQKEHRGVVGQFILALPSVEKKSSADELCRKFVKLNNDWDIVIGLSTRSETITSLARELLALEEIKSTVPELAGDPVARLEVDTRITQNTEELEKELRHAFDGADWYCNGRKARSYRYAEINNLASELARDRFEATPILHNELLNRQKPSSSASSGRRRLLHRMVQHEGKERLGIDLYPVERGLFDSILDETGLYAENKEGKLCFQSPKKGEADKSRLFPAWDKALSYIREHRDRIITVEEIYKIWRAPPFGIKSGLMPVLITAFILAERRKIAIYSDDTFCSNFTDVDVDYLVKAPEVIQLRWLELSSEVKSLLSGLGNIVRDLGDTGEFPTLEPIDVARGLISIYDKLPSWTKRTKTLSRSTLKTGEIFKRARDPNRFLFDDLPQLAGIKSINKAKAREQVISEIRNGLSELVHAYPGMLHGLRDLMLRELRVMNSSQQALEQLRGRAENIKQLSGDFQLEAFIGRLSQFNGSDESFEGIASLAANKSPRDWIDLDLERATLTLAELSRNFVHAESFAHVKGRRDKMRSIAIVIGSEDGRKLPLHEEIYVADSDEDQVENLVTLIDKVLKGADMKKQNLILAALADIISKHLTESASEDEDSESSTLKVKKKQK